MRQHQRMLCRIANRRGYHPHFGRKFDKLVVTRKSWGYWFVARVAGMPRIFLPPPLNPDFVASLMTERLVDKSPPRDDLRFFWS